MNKTFYIFLLFLMCFCCETKSQTEYITNGSFEQIDSCNGCIANLGFDIFQWSGCKGWSNPIYSSSDLWCQNGKICTLQPPNTLYFQYPKTGNNMAGFFIGDAGGLYNYREYVQNSLTKQLTIGRYYQIEFHLSSIAGSCNISEIGVKFYNQQLLDLTKLNLTNVIADVANNDTNFITDTLGWKKISLKYKATGNENFMVIGCFIDSLHLKSDYTCDTSGWIGQIFPRDYMFIDDVSVLELPFQEPMFPNIFTPNSDGSNDFWHIDLSGYENINCNIYNRWGVKIFQTNNTNLIWDGKKTNGESCNDGNYFYTIEGLNQFQEKIYYKGFIQIIR